MVRPRFIDTDNSDLAHFAANMNRTDSIHESTPKTYDDPLFVALTAILKQFLVDGASVMVFHQLKSNPIVEITVLKQMPSDWNPTGKANLYVDGIKELVYSWTPSKLAHSVNVEPSSTRPGSSVREERWEWVDYAPIPTDFVEPFWRIIRKHMRTIGFTEDHGYFMTKHDGKLIKLEVLRMGSKKDILLFGI